jgi:predicted ribosomally synthesized peptide with SipW-like signal peptide
MDTRTKVLRTLGVLAALSALAAAGVFSAFSSQTDSPGNTITVGTVTLSDDDGGAALYSLAAAKPGDSRASCIRVEYAGSLDAVVKLYTPSSIEALGDHVDLEVEAGTQATSSFPSCAGFTPDAGGPLYDGTLASFASAHGSFADGLADNPGTSATKWVTDDAVVYRVTATLSADAPDSAQGETTGSHTLRWEAQNL